ncbi:MAG: tetratricopeptide repeat protein [Pseudomonadota bacterium]
MKTFAAMHRPLLAALAVALAAPVIAQSSQTDPNAEARIRKLEAEVRALQRSVFPGGDGKFFPPLAQPGQPTTAATGTPASTPVADLLVRVDAIEAQLARLTAQQEEAGNKLAQLEAKVAALTPAAPASVAAVPAEVPASATAVTATNGATTSGNLAAMTGGASAAKPAVTTPAATTPTATASLAAKPAATKPAATKPAAAAPKPAVPSAARLAAVRAIEKPKTADAGDDEYSYGFRLWEAKFYPEAQQQLKLFLEKYPRHERRSFARNLLGRALLDEGKPEEAQKWFLENYKDRQFRDRAADSVLFLAEATKRQKDTARACIALAQFVDEFPNEAAGRLKGQYDATRTGLKCD